MENTKALWLIRRANLDMLWSREKNTVIANHNRIKEILCKWHPFRRSIPLPEISAWKVEDQMGMGIAMMTLVKSMEKGRITNYTQFDACRHLRGTVSNMYGATASANEQRQVFKSRDGRVFHSHQDPMQSNFMERFMKGMRARMPEESERNLPLGGLVVQRLLEEMEFEWALPTTTAQRKRKLTMTAAYISVTYTLSLRGNEGFWVDGDALCDHIQLGKEDKGTPHVAIALLGFFKGEAGERMHVFVAANITKSGVRIRRWLERVVETLQVEKKRGGPAFCDEEGYILDSQQIEDVMHPFLDELQGSKGLEQALPRGIDVATYYRCARSFRRGAANTAAVNKVNETTIKFVNRWRSYEKNQGKSPGFDMLQHYTDGEGTRPLQLAFTSAV